MRIGLARGFAQGLAGRRRILALDACRNDVLHLHVEHRSDHLLRHRIEAGLHEALVGPVRKEPASRDPGEGEALGIDLCWSLRSVGGRLGRLSRGGKGGKGDDGGKAGDEGKGGKSDDGGKGGRGS